MATRQEVDLSSIWNEIAYVYLLLNLWSWLTVSEIHLAKKQQRLLIIPKHSHSSAKKMHKAFLKDNN